MGKVRFKYDLSGQDCGHTLCVVPSLATALLAEIADGFAAATDLWRPLVTSDLPQRRCERLLVDEHYEVWLLQWGAGHGVELHDHGSSAAAFTVVQGELIDISPMTDDTICRRTLTVGNRRLLRPGAVHDVVNASSTPAVSVHVYSPPLTSMTYYDPLTLTPLRTEPVPFAPPVLDSVDPRELHPASSTSR